jgi:putative FmdB family regulatory protein
MISWREMIRRTVAGGAGEPAWPPTRMGLRPLFLLAFRADHLMPIYEYECRQCGHQFELLVLRGTVVACPACGSGELERLLSGFAVSSEGIRQANVQAARRQHAASKDFKDKKIADGEHIREHVQEYKYMKEHTPPPKK